VGRLELAAFVVVPAFLPLIFGGQWRSALATAATNLVLLALVYATLGYGLPSILRWTGMRLFGQLHASLALLTRAIPLLMIFSVVLFLTTEMWQVFAEASTFSLVGMAVLFVGLGTAFLVARLPRELEALERDARADAPPLGASASTSARALREPDPAGPLRERRDRRLLRRAWRAVRRQSLTASWIGQQPDVLVEFHLFGDDQIVTTELLRVAGAIAAFTGLYFAISMLTDEVYRREFLDELTVEMRHSFEARAEYARLARPRIA
jgi:hypothetical protein